MCGHICMTYDMWPYASQAQLVKGHSLTCVARHICTWEAWEALEGRDAFIVASWTALTTSVQRS